MTQTDTEEEITIVRDIPEEAPAPQLPAVASQAGQERAGPKPEYVSEEHADSEFFDSATMEFMLRVAKLMAAASLIPEALWCVGTGANKKSLPFATVVANCFLIVNQARLWKIDAFALAQASSVVHGRVMFEGKVIAAVLERTRGIALRYKWNDLQGDAFGIRCEERDAREGEAEKRAVEGTVGQWATKKKGGARSDNWMPGAARQQLAYRAAREWCRLYEPGLIMGVIAGDDGEVMAERLAEERAAGTVETPAFGAGFKTGAPGAGERREAMKRRQGARKPRFPQEARQEEPEATSQDGPGAGESAPAPKTPGDVASPAQPSASVERDAFGRFLEERLPQALSWADIKGALELLMKSAEWIAALRAKGPECRDALGKAWHRERALMALRKGEADVSIQEDLLAFRCWLEAQTSSVAIGQTWEAIQTTNAFEALKPATRTQLAAVVETKLEETRAVEARP